MYTQRKEFGVELGRDPDSANPPYFHLWWGEHGKSPGRSPHTLCACNFPMEMSRLVLLWYHTLRWRSCGTWHVGPSVQVSETGESSGTLGTASLINF